MIIIQSLNQHTDSRGITSSYLFSYKEVDEETYYTHIFLRDLEEHRERWAVSETDQLEINLSTDSGKAELRLFINTAVSTILNDQKWKDKFYLNGFPTSSPDLQLNLLYNLLNLTQFTDAAFRESILNEIRKSFPAFIDLNFDFNFNENSLLGTLDEVLKTYYKKDLYKDGSSYIIHYPYIKITNSSGRYHDIYDLYVKITPELRRRELSLTFQGARGTLSDKELRACYIHSHLHQGTSFFNFTGFCFGEGHMKAYLLVKRSDFLYTLPAALDRYVEWESMEGGPYIYISSVPTNTSSSSQVTLTSSLQKHIIKECIEKNKFNIEVSDRDIKININSSYAPDVYHIKLKNNIITSKDLEKLKVSTDLTEDSFKETIMAATYTVSDSEGKKIVLKSKKIEKISETLEKATILSFRETFGNNYNTSVQNIANANSAIVSIINKYKNELIEFE